MGLAAGGWSLFSHPSEAEQLALAGQQHSVMLPSLRTVTAVPVLPERAAAAPRPSRSAVSGSGLGHRAAHPDFPAAEPRPSAAAAPEAPTVVVPTPKAPVPDAGVPELLPKTTEGLRVLTDSAEALTSKLKAPGEPTASPRPAEPRPADLNWAAVARCASDGDPKAVTPEGAHGLYHFTVEDWRSVGGTGLPSEATPQEQTKRAQLLYLRENGHWQALWPECGRLLFLK